MGNLQSMNTNEIISLQKNLSSHTQASTERCTVTVLFQDDVKIEQLPTGSRSRVKRRRIEVAKSPPWSQIQMKDESIGTRSATNSPVQNSIGTV